MAYTACKNQKELAVRWSVNLKHAQKQNLPHSGGGRVGGGGIAKAASSTAPAARHKGQVRLKLRRLSWKKFKHENYYHMLFKQRNMDLFEAHRVNVLFAAPHSHGVRSPRRVQA